VLGVLGVDRWVSEVARLVDAAENRAMDKGFLIAQLRERLDDAAKVASHASEAAALEVREGATPAERREDGRTALEYGGLARGLAGRAAAARGAADALATFRPAPLKATAPISVGAIVEVEDDDTGEGRTFFLAPVGAGVTLTGPGGDGYLSVVTPASPIGRAVLGRRRGDVIDITVEGAARSWAITDVA